MILVRISFALPRRIRKLHHYINIPDRAPRLGHHHITTMCSRLWWWVGQKRKDFSPFDLVWGVEQKVSTRSRLGNSFIGSAQKLNLSNYHSLTRWLTANTSFVPWLIIILQLIHFIRGSLTSSSSSPSLFLTADANLFKLYIKFIQSYADRSLCYYSYGYDNGRGDDDDNLWWWSRDKVH